MKKPSVYLDTNILSSYWYDGGDVLAISRRNQTRDWWETERKHFEVWASVVTESELSAGEYSKQVNCVRMVRRLKFLPIPAEARDLANRLMELGVIPDNKSGDAYQMALCTVHRIDYLLTWNYAHLANPLAQERLNVICKKLDFAAPLLVTPESMPKVAMGQPIRRT